MVGNMQIHGQTLPSSCHLLAGTFATCLQIIVGCFAGLSLLYKYYILESPRRSWDVWILDISKQGVTSILIHFWNITQSILFTKLSKKKGNNVNSDECANYFMYFVLDTCLGVYFVYILLSFIHEIATKYSIRSLKTQGYYGTPRRMSWYFRQLFCFLLVTVISKLVLGFIMFILSKPADMIANMLFQPLQNMNPNIELVFVMVVCPFFLNMIQYWIQDNFLMSRMERPSYRLVEDQEKETLSELSNLSGELATAPV